jgi:cytochrome c-type biogenesis protein CcmF
MPILGSLALLFALALSMYNLVIGVVALRQIATANRGRISPERLAETARLAGLASFATVSLAVFALLWAIFTNDFSLAYVLHESNRALPGCDRSIAKSGWRVHQQEAKPPEKGISLRVCIREGGWPR